MSRPLIYRPHDWFDTQESKPMFAAQVTFADERPPRWMHVVADGKLITFDTAEERDKWVTEQNRGKEDLFQKYEEFAKPIEEVEQET